MESLISRALSRDLLFAAWREAGDKDVGFTAQISPEINARGFETNPGPCFVLAPFSKDEESVFIRPDILLSSCQDSSIELPEVNYTRKFSAGKNNQLSENEYMHALELLIAAIRKGKAEKVVFSRLALEDASSIDIAGLFERLLEANPTAFVYILNLPGSITWLGASPEILLKEEGGKCTTMALAGTKTFSGQNNEWTGKELAEHGFVSDYIEGILRENKCSFQSTQLNSKRLDSGIVHLCREYVFKLPNDYTFLDLAYALHPTPAVGGMPINEALVLISRHEGLKRSYYTGFLGPYKLNGRSAFYVNIRCGRIAEGMVHMFAGGGITIESEQAAEWNETRLKLQTMQMALNSQRKLQIFSE